MAIELPRASQRSSGEPAPRRGRRLPDAGNVPQVRLAADPGLRVPDLASAAGGLGDIGAVLGDIGQSIERVMAKQQRLVDANAKTEARDSISRGMFERFQEQQNAPDFDPREFDESNDTFISQIIAGLPDGVSEETRADILDQATRAREIYFERALLSKNDREKTKADDLFSASLKEKKLQVFRNPSTLSLAIDNVRAQLGDLQGTLFTPDSLRDAEQGAIESLTEAAMSGLIQEEPTLALAILTTEKPNLDSPFENLPLDRREALTARALARIKDLERQESAAQKELDVQLKAENARKASDLEIAVSRGQAGFAEVEQAFDEGIITPAKRTQLVKNIDKRVDGEAVTTNGLFLVSAALSGEVVLDPNNKDHRDFVNIYFQTIVSQNLADTDPAEQVQGVVDFIARVGMVPAQVQGQIRGSLASGSVKRKVFAADLLGRIKNSNPAALRDFAKADIDLGLHIQSQIERGVDPEDAVRRAEEAAALSQAEREVFDQRARDEKLSENAMSFLEDKAAGGLFGTDAVIPPALQAEFTTATNDAFKRTGGDIDAALDVAFAETSQLWASTNVAGSRRMMKFAPERFGPPRFDLETNAEWMREQLLDDIGVGSAFDPDQGPLEDRLRLEADDQTAREASSGTPSYLVMLRDANGAFEPLLTADGVVTRWRPDWTTSPAFARAEEERAERQREALESGKRVRESLENELPVVVN